MHKFKFQPPQQHRRSLQQPKNEHIGIINTLQKCSQILRQDRLWLRNQIKNNNNQVLEIFKLYARSSQLQQLQIKLRKYVQAVKNKLKSQQLSRFKDTLNLNNNAFSSISNVMPEPKRTNHQMKSIHTQQKSSNLKHNNSVELNRTTNVRPNNSTDHLTNKMNNTLQVSNSLRHFQQMLKFKYNQEVIEERQSQNVTSARQARQENQNNCPKPLQQQIFDTFQNKKAGKSTFNNFVNKPIQEKYDFPTNFFKPSHKANQTVIQKKKEPWQFQKVAKKALYNYKDQHSQNKEDKCYQSRKEDMPAFDEMEDSIFDKHFDQSDKATNHFDLNGGLNLNGAQKLNGGLNLPNNDYKSYSFNQPESIKSIHEVIGVPFRQQSNFQSTKYDYNDQTQESKNGQIDFRQSQKSNTDKNNFKVDQELFTPLQLLNQCRKFLKHRQNSSKKTDKINDEQQLKTNQIKQNRVIELPPEQIPECLFNRNNYKEQSQQKQMPNEHKQEESYLFPEIKQSNQKKQLQLSHHYEEEPAYVQESNTPHYEELPTPQNQLEHQHMEYAPAQPTSKLPDNFNIQEMLEDLMEVTEMNPFITKPSLLKYIISHRNSYILKDILDEKLKGSKEQICITNIASLLNNAYNSTNEEPYSHDDSQITLVYNLLDIDQKNYINKDDISSFLSQIEEAEIDNFEQISDQLWRLFDGADFDNEQQLTYWHFFLVYSIHNPAKTATNSKEQNNYSANSSSKQNAIDQFTSSSLPNYKHRPYFPLVESMLHSKKQMADKDRKVVFAREIVTKNPIFTKEHCEDFFEMFNLYCDNRRQCDVSDILNTARTLGFDKKYKIIYEALEAVSKDLAGEWVDFETFLKLITQKVGNPFSESGRRAMFTLVDPEQKEFLQFSDLRKISQNLKYNLTDEQIQQVVNNVAGFGKIQISWQQFNKYIAKKVEKKDSSY